MCCKFKETPSRHFNGTQHSMNAMNVCGKLQWVTINTHPNVSSVVKESKGGSMSRTFFQFPEKEIRHQQKGECFARWVEFILRIGGVDKRNKLLLCTLVAATLLGRKIIAWWVIIYLNFTLLMKKETNWKVILIAELKYFRWKIDFIMSCCWWIKDKNLMEKGVFWSLCGDNEIEGFL